jgi:hypothetical protein
MTEHVFLVPNRIMEYLLITFESGVITVDANMLRHVRENAVWRTALCREMDRGGAWGAHGFTIAPFGGDI